ncbi:MAG: hypothetical protein E6J91_50495 [Deltaproteobacteria bacterium]|nr:MAG: hypothetical protein E6J91_50495 [Deltaproteobacteria bacterium]
MSRLRTVLITAAIALPLGAFAKDAMLKGHPNLQKARAALNEADRFITASQKANEHVWGDEGGHGKRAKEAIATAKQELDLAAEWVNSHEK